MNGTRKTRVDFVGRLILGAFLVFGVAVAAFIHVQITAPVDTGYAPPASAPPQTPAATTAPAKPVTAAAEPTTEEAPVTTTDQPEPTSETVSPSEPTTVEQPTGVDGKPLVADQDPAECTGYIGDDGLCHPNAAPPAPPAPADTPTAADVPDGDSGINDDAQHSPVDGGSDG